VKAERKKISKVVLVRDKLYVNKRFIDPDKYVHTETANFPGNQNVPHRT
jgi:hypothetical protein